MKNIVLFVTVTLFAFVMIAASCRRTHSAAPAAAGGYPPAIASILVSKCTYAGCHTPASYMAAGQLQLDTWAHLFQGGISGAVVVPYCTGYSPLLYYCNTDSTLGTVFNDPGHFGAHPAPTKDDYLALVSWIAKGAPDSSGNVAFASNPDTRQKIYLSQSESNLIAVIDGQSKLVMRYIPVGQVYPGNNSIHDVRVSGDGKYAYVSFYGWSSLQKIDTRTDTVVGYVDLTSAALGGEGSWGILMMSPADTAVMVSGFDQSGYLVTVNTANMQINNNLSDDIVTVGPNPANGIVYPHGIASNAAFNTFFVTEEYGNVVDRITFAPMFKITPISIDGNPPVAGVTATSRDPHQIQMVPDRSRYFVTCENSNELRVMDAKADTLIKVIPVGTFPQEMALWPSKNYLFVTCLNDSVNRPQGLSVTGNIGTVFVIDYNTYDVVAILTGDFNTPHDLAVDSQDGFLYVASENSYFGSGIPPHHKIAGGTPGWYTVYDLNTLKPADNLRYEVALFPYAICSRF